jgi:hypothetical protein
VIAEIAAGSTSERERQKERERANNEYGRMHSVEESRLKHKRERERERTNNEYSRMYSVEESVIQSEAKPSLPKEEKELQLERKPRRKGAAIPFSRSLPEAAIQSGKETDTVPGREEVSSKREIGRKRVGSSETECIQSKKACYIATFSRKRIRQCRRKRKRK